MLTCRSLLVHDTQLLEIYLREILNTGQCSKLIQAVHTGVSVVDVAGCCSDLGRGSSVGGGAGGGVSLAELLWMSPASPFVT